MYRFSRFKSQNGPNNKKELIMQHDNYFKCPDCGCVTKHVEISFMEFVATKKKGAIHRLFAMFQDITGASRLAGSLTGLREYKCSKCGLVNQRGASGKINELWNE